MREGGKGERARERRGIRRARERARGEEGEGPGRAREG